MPAQNLYVQPPTRGNSIDYRNPMTPMTPPMVNGADAAARGGRSRGPLALDQVLYARADYPAIVSCFPTLL